MIKKYTATLFALLALATGISSSALGQVAQPSPYPDSAPAAPPPGAIIRPAQEVDQLVGPIALYPDPLIAEVLPASTQPGEVMAANQFLRDGNSPASIDLQPWDTSIKALARYPDLLRWMADNIAWTTQLGQAFVYQPAEVMAGVQRMRARAQAMGNLVSTPQQQVVAANQVIEILPANPEIIYVPVYRPEYVYYRPPPPGRFWIGFGIGFHVGIWFNHDCDWRNREVIVWGHDHPRPHDWWVRPPAERYRPLGYREGTIVERRVVNEHVEVWHPRPGAGAPAHFEGRPSGTSHSQGRPVTPHSSPSGREGRDHR